MEPEIDSCPDPYHILELPNCADKQAIKKAYKKLNIECHPDKNRRSDANAVIREINCARAKLLDPGQKLSLDQWLGSRGQCGRQTPNDRVCGSRVTKASSIHRQPYKACALIRKFLLYIQKFLSDVPDWLRRVLSQYSQGSHRSCESSGTESISSRKQPTISAFQSKPQTGPISISSDTQAGHIPGSHPRPNYSRPLTRTMTLIVATNGSATQTTTRSISAKPTETRSSPWTTALTHKAFTPQTLGAAAATASIAILGVGSYLVWREQRLRRSRRIADLKRRTISGSSSGSSSGNARSSIGGSAKKSRQSRTNSGISKAERRRSSGSRSSIHRTSGVTRLTEEGNNARGRAPAPRKESDPALMQLSEAKQKLVATKGKLRQKKSGKKVGGTLSKGVQDPARLASASRSWSGTGSTDRRETLRRRSAQSC